MKKPKTLWLMGATALVAMLSACGGGSSSAEAEAAAIPTDGILGELPKVVAEYEAAEAAASVESLRLDINYPSALTGENFHMGPMECIV